MTDLPSLSDDDLHDYIDGRMDTKRLAAAEQVLAGNPELAARVAAYRMQQESIRQLYNPILDDPVPARLREPVQRARRSARQHVCWRIAASILFLAAGAAGGWFANGYFASESYLLKPFINQAILSHKLATATSPEGLNVDRLDPDRLSPSYVPANFGAPVRIPTLRKSNLLPVALVSGKDANGARVTVTYADEQKRRRTLFIRKLSSGDSLPVKFSALEEMPVLYWIDGPLIYILVGEGDKSELLTIAEEIYRSPAVGVPTTPPK